MECSIAAFMSGWWSLGPGFFIIPSRPVQGLSFSLRKGFGTYLADSCKQSSGPCLEESDQVAQALYVSPRDSASPTMTRTVSGFPM